jgi:hypothetical protein
MVSLSILRPMDDKGGAVSQSPDSFLFAAKSLVEALGSESARRDWKEASTTAVSQFF